jgi:hypothetical protein
MRSNACQVESNERVGCLPSHKAKEKRCKGCIYMRDQRIPNNLAFGL